MTISPQNIEWADYKTRVIAALSYQDVYGSIQNVKNGNSEWSTGLCPFHDDKQNSFAFNKKTLQFCCFAGCGKGSVIDFLAHMNPGQFKDILLGEGDKKGIERPKSYARKKPSSSAIPPEERPPIDPRQIEIWMKSLEICEKQLIYLKEERGLNEDTIKKYRLGWDEIHKRITIPVMDESGAIVNVRLYAPKAGVGVSKYLNYISKDGHIKYGSPPRLYSLYDLKKSDSKQVIHCEGEMDRLLLQQEGFMAVTGTHGCSVFSIEWVKHFEGKDVVIIMDCDENGKKAVEGNILPAFKNSGVKASSIKNITLPLSGEKDENDITDYFIKKNLTAKDLQTLIDNTPIHIFEEEKKEEEIIELNSFTEIEKKELINRKVSCEITINGETSESFHAVESFEVTWCRNRDQSSTCSRCPKRPIILPRGSAEYIGVCMSSDYQVTGMLQSSACFLMQKPAVKVHDKTTVREFICHQRITRMVSTRDKDGNIEQFIDGKKQELFEKRVYYLSSEPARVGSYRAVGWIKTHPKTQQITLLIESLVPLEDDFQRFTVEKYLPELSAMKKYVNSLEEIWNLEDEFSENITGIYERPDILFATLLTYAAPRRFVFNNELIRGWLITAIIGDSGSGKTQTYQRISEYIGIGDVFSGLTGSRTGLSYAIVDHKQSGWQVRVGRYPANSRKILCIDEVQKVEKAELETLQKAMDEGYMQVDRIRSQGFEAETRLLMIGNPKWDKTMDTHMFGCQTLAGIYSPPFIRRIDLAVFSNSSDIDSLALINKLSTKKSKHRVTPDMLKSLIYWAWNLKPEQIIFNEQATKEVILRATEMSLKFGFPADIPLVPGADFRKKLARLSVAFAVLSCSTDDFTTLQVTKKHVEHAINLLNTIYSSDNCGLDDYSEIYRGNIQITDYDEIERAFIHKQNQEKHSEVGENYFTKAIYFLRINEAIRRDDLAEQVGCSNESISKIIHFLKSFNLLDSDKRGYTKKQKFIKFLRKFLKVNPNFLKKPKDVVWLPPLSGSKDELDFEPEPYTAN